MANKNLIINSDMMLEQKVLALLGCIAQEHKAEMERLINPMKLSLLQLNILHTLDKSPNGSLTVNQLKSAMFDQNPNVSRTLNKLVENDLIIKERSSEDQRTVFISITQSGRKAHRAADKELLTFSSGLSGRDLEQLYSLLLKL
ncbi:MAG: MarR family transcriptional regulator [Sneathiella sp.]